MFVFAVVLTEPTEETKRRKQSHYPDYHELTPNVFLVSSEEFAKEVKAKIGIGADGADGVVFRLNHAYSGYTSRDTWEWLSRAEQMA